jgi:ribulose-5-phosphate 4-epimerase/fuculose-1-phosphate aldolase
MFQRSAFFLKIFILRNHGMIACGETIEEVWSYAFHLALACETQLRALSLGIDNLILSPEDASEQVRTHLY